MGTRGASQAICCLERRRIDYIFLYTFNEISGKRLGRQKYVQINLSVLRHARYMRRLQ